MKFAHLVTFLSLLTSFAFAETPSAKAKEQMRSPYDQTMSDIDQTLGLVPTFFKVYPKAGLPAAWAQFKGIQMNPNTVLSGKEKELIGLAVSAQIPCDYCVYAHTEFAKLNGAKNEEIQEAVAVAALARQWSAVTNGRPVGMKEFKSEVDDMFSYMDKRKDQKDSKKPESTREEIEQTFGTMPSMFQRYPEPGLAGGFGSFQFLMSKNTSLPPKLKSLITLAVSAQTPCSYCVYYSTKSLKRGGASMIELDEAVAMAALTRHWSTVLNGNNLDSKQFRKEVDQIVANVKKAQEEEAKKKTK